MLLPMASEAGAPQTLPVYGTPELPNDRSSIMDPDRMWLSSGGYYRTAMMNLEGQRSETQPAMSITLNVATVLKDHVFREVEGID